MSVTCSPCTTDDVILALSQLSEQLQNLSAYIVIVTCVATASVILAGVVVAFGARVR